MVFTDAMPLAEDAPRSARALPLIPLPTQVTVDAGELLLPSLHVAGEPDTAMLLQDDLQRRFGDVPPAGESDAVAIELSIDGQGDPEGYTLDSRGDRIRISGHDAAGLYYGARTLLQLLQPGNAGWSVPRVLIEDAPRFAYRGVMLDVVRRFFPVDEVEAYIDRAVALKLNHLHLHLTDDQGWRIEIESWPRLTERASIGEAGDGPGGFYSKADYRRIVEYAAARHMTIVPEIDLPGHTHAVGVAYPDLVEEPWISEKTLAESTALRQPLPVHGEHYAGWAVGHSSLRLDDEQTDRFVRDVLGEVAALTPGPYLHVGGDECLNTPPAAFAAFFERVTRIASATGKTPVAWHEAGAVQDIASGTIGQYWGMAVPQGSHAAEAAHFVARGGKLIMSPCDRSYLDMKPDADFPLGLAWAGTIPLQAAYDWDPADVVASVPQSAILGVEAPLWTETIESFPQADALVFPRLTAHAEIAWSAADGAERTWESFCVRLQNLIPVLRASGVTIGTVDGVDAAGSVGYEMPS